MHSRFCGRPEVDLASMIDHYELVEMVVDTPAWLRATKAVRLSTPVVILLNRAQGSTRVTRIR